MVFAGILTVEVEVASSVSLKDKRHVIKSILDTARNRFHVSAAEVEHLNSHKMAGLAFACVGNEAAFVNSVLNKVLDHIRSNPLCEIVDSSMEMV